MISGDGSQCFYCLAPECEKICRGTQRLGAAYYIDQTIEQPRGPFLERCRLGFIHALCLDNVISLNNQIQHLRNHLRWMLPITIHCNDRLAGRSIHPGSKCSLMTKVSA